MSKDNWFLGETWPSTAMRNTPSSALTAFPILAVKELLLAKWEPPATQSKPKSKPRRLRVFSYPQKFEAGLNNSESWQSQLYFP